MNRRDQEPTNTYSSHTRTSSDEVDLGVIAHKIQKGFAGLGRKLSYLLLMIARRLPLMALAVGAGIGLAYFRFVNTPPEYTSEMILTCNEIRNDFCQDLVKKLNLSIQDGNYQDLSRKLHIDEPVARTLSSVSYALVNERTVPNDTILVGQPFVVKVTTFDNTVFDTVQAGIHHYLETNKYFSAIKSIRKQRLEQLVQKLNQEINQIDSMKMQVNLPSGLSNANGLVLGQADPVNLFREGIIYFNQKQEAAAGLTMINNFHIISELTPRQKPASPQISTHLIWGGILGLIIGIIIGLVLDNRNGKKESQTTYQDKMMV